MFKNTSDFAFVGPLEASWEAIRREFEQLKPDSLKPWHETGLYNRGWETFGLWALGQRLDDNCALCPATAAAVERIPGLTTAGFSQMAPGTEIKPHVGYTNAVLRCHLGVVVPEDCALKVGEETLRWQEGRCLIFDDTILHSAWNRSQQPRIVLLLDFKRPRAPFNPKYVPRTV